MPKNARNAQVSRQEMREARKPIEAGFEYVTDTDGYKLFRKRKRPQSKRLYEKLDA